MKYEGSDDTIMREYPPTRNRDSPLTPTCEQGESKMIVPASRPTPGRGYLWWLLGIILGLAIIVPLAGFACYTQRGWTTWKVERVAAHELSPGLPRDQVEAVMDSHGFAHEWYDPAQPPSSPDEVPDIPRDYFEDVKRSTGADGKFVLIARVPDPNVDLICEGKIWVYCFFDQDGRLLKAIVREWICSL
jgi:hypothetical protein